MRNTYSESAHTSRIVWIFAGCKLNPDIAQQVFLLIPDFTTQIILTAGGQAGAYCNTYDKQDFQVEYFGNGQVYSTNAFYSKS